MEVGGHAFALGHNQGPIAFMTGLAKTVVAANLRRSTRSSTRTKALGIGAILIPEVSLDATHWL